MSILDAPVATYSRSDLRKPEVLEVAQQGPVEIRNPSGDLLLLRRSDVDRIRELRDAVEDFLRVLVEVRRPDPSPIVLGDVGFVSNWSAEDRAKFLEGYAEALDASLRANDPNPVRLFIKAMVSSPRVSDRPDFDGRISDTAYEGLAARLS